MKIVTPLKCSGLLLIGLVSGSSAHYLNWGEPCRSVNIREGLIQCAGSANPNRCLQQFINPYSPDLLQHKNNEPLSRKSHEWHLALRETPVCQAYDHGAEQSTILIAEGITHLGQIPAGKAEVQLTIDAAANVDLQLLDSDTALVARDSGLLWQESQAVADYQGLTITYSGHGGLNGQPGHEMIHISGITHSALTLQLVSAADVQADLSWQWGIDPALGAINISSETLFDELAGRNSIPGAFNLREVKFFIKDIQTNYPSLYFINGQHVPLHIDFLYDVLGWYPSLNYDQAYRQFSSSTYFLDDRQHLAGSIMAHDHLGVESPQSPQLYTLNMWPTDPVPAHLLIKAYELLTQHMPTSETPLIYHLASDTQTQIYQQQADLFTARQVPVIDSEALFAGQSFAPMNAGEGYGRLRIISEGDDPPSVSDVVIFTFVPNDLTHVAGIITDTAQTPLSHINLKAKQNRTPNAYVADATTHPDIEPLIDQLVHYQVSQDGFSLSGATQQEVDSWLASVRPANSQEPQSDLTATQPARLDNLGHEDWIRYGAKAANVAELARVLEPGSYPVGYAIPFATYDKFMQLNRCQGLEDDGITPDGKFRDLCVDENDPHGKSLYEQIAELMADPQFINEPSERHERLADFRKTVRKAEVPEEMANTLESIRYFWDPDGVFTHSIRLRSSTNNEDLEGFNGAGLYESNTHHPDEGMIAESVKKVWASLWTARAFEERRFYRIDHFKTYMGVLAHLSYGDEQVNGVAVTKNIYDRNWEGYYVNAQYGEISVTNPEPIITADGEVGAIPDEFLLSRLVASDDDYQWIQQYIRHSNVEVVYGAPVPTEHVLTEDEVTQLRQAMQAIQQHFKVIYDGDEHFAMDIEFKITATDDGSRGHLEIKQARPWID